MSTLSTYLKSVQLLLNDPTETNFNRFDLITYINEARQQIAGTGQCVRAIPFVGQVVQLIQNTAGTGGTPGTGYPLVFTGTNTALASGTYDVTSTGTVTNLQLISGGNGYLSAPAVSCGGAGFAGGVQPQIVCLLASGIPTAINQEIYPFSGVSFANQPGIAGIIGVRGVSILWNTYRFTTARYSFSKYQARVRVYNNTFTDVPRVSAQFGQGESGSIYLYPVPNAVYIMEWDCICDVTPLIDDTTVELIPAPWNTCVQYYAAYKAQEIAQNFDIADRMYKAYERFMKLARTQSQPGAVANWYGRA